MLLGSSANFVVRVPALLAPPLRRGDANYKVRATAHCVTAGRNSPASASGAQKKAACQSVQSAVAYRLSHSFPYTSRFACPPYPPAARQPATGPAADGRRLLGPGLCYAAGAFCAAGGPAGGGGRGLRVAAAHAPTPALGAGRGAGFSAAVAAGHPGTERRFLPLPLGWAAGQPRP